MKIKTFGIWEVNEEGILGDGYYFIDRPRILENPMRWPMHVATKRWADFYNFEKAFIYFFTLVKHNYSLDQIQDALDARYGDKLQ